MGKGLNMAALTSLGTVLGAFKSIKDTAESIVSLRDQTVIAGKVGEINAKLLDAQSSIFAVNEERTALVERVRELEKHITDLEAWEAEKQRYELRQVTTGYFCYQLKPEMSTGEPLHRLCADCYAAGKKKFLQQQISGPSLDRFACGGCGQTIDVHKGTSSHTSAYIDFDPFKT
jgi:hypothetical protein